MSTSKVLCGLCSRVLLNPGRRQPTRGEQAQLDALAPTVESGALLYKLTRPRYNPADVSWITAEGEMVYAFHCPGCHVTYRPKGFLRLIEDANTRGEPVVLRPPTRP